MKVFEKSLLGLCTQLYTPFRYASQPNIKPVQQRKCPKSHKRDFEHLQTFFPDETHGNNFFVLHKCPGLFTKSKMKAELQPKMHPKW